MSSSFEKFQKRKLISSYFSVTLSIALILFLLGSLALLLLNSQKLVNHFKENIKMSIFLEATTKEAEISQLQQKLAMAEYTRTVTFISKEEAAESFMKELGENFVEYYGDNFLLDHIDLNLKADYVTPEQMNDIATEIKGTPFVEEIAYDQPLAELLTENVKKITYYVLIACGMVLLVSVLLINSSIRLSIYSKRFIIKTMQMVGATKRFIRWPFILTNIKLGMIGSVIAIALLTTCLSFLDNNYPELGLFNDTTILASIYAGIFIFGILISWVSTFFAAQRYLNLRTDELYY